MTASNTADLIAKHLDWSDKQRRILTADGQAETFFHPDLGFSFENSELPHYHLMKGNDRDIFREWKKDQQQNLASPIAGAWKRVLLYGGWEFTTEADERTFNFQTSTLFIDLRIPKTRDKLQITDESQVTSIHDLDADQLRFYARQHVFAGYSKLQSFQSTTDDATCTAPYPWSCTRHHIMDWNFVGMPRTRPNKWWIEPHAGGDVWKEWAFAKDLAGQHYYCEQWERLNDKRFHNDNDSKEPLMLALRMNPNEQGKDGVLIVMGNEFTYCLSQRSHLMSSHADLRPASLVALVDDVISQGDSKTARQWLGSMQGGHGHVHTSADNPTHNSWTIDAAVEFWKQGKSLLFPGDVTVNGSSVEDAVITWNGEPWSVFESSIDEVDTLVRLFGCLQMRRRVG